MKEELTMIKEFNNKDTISQILKESLRTRIFGLTNVILHVTNLSKRSFFILMLIETFQKISFLSYLMRRESTILDGVVLRLMDYSHFGLILRSGDQISAYTAMGCSLAILLILFGSCIYIAGSLNKNHTFKTSPFLLLVCFLLQVLNRTLYFPLSQTFLSFILCSPHLPQFTGTCYSGNHLIASLASCLGLALLVILMVYCAFVLVETNPFCDKNMAMSENIDSGFELMLKTLGVFAFMFIDYKAVFNFLIAVILALKSTCLILRLIDFGGYFNKSIAKIWLFFDISRFVLIFYYFVFQIFNANPDNLLTSSDLLTASLLVIPLTVISNHLINKKPLKILSVDFTKIKGEKHFSILFITLRALFKYKNSEENSYLLYSFFEKNEEAFELFSENHPDFPGIVKNLKASLSSSKPRRSTKEAKMKKVNLVKLTNIDPNDKNFFLKTQLSKFDFFLLKLLQIGLEIFPGSSKIQLLLAQFQMNKIKFNWMALYSLMKLAKSRTNLLQTLSIYRTIIKIQLRVIRENIDKRHKDEFDAVTLLKYQERNFKFMKTIHNCLPIYSEFWRELDHSNPSPEKISSLGSKIANANHEISSQYAKIEEMNLGRLRTRTTYAGFLKLVAHDEAALEVVNDKMMEANQVYYANKSKNKEGDIESISYETTTILTLSADRERLGEILNVSNEILRSLGYKPVDIIGEKIDLLMPKFYSDRHDGFMKRFFNSGIVKVMHGRRVVFPRTKKGYIKPMNLRLMVMPYFERGTKLLGVMSRVGFNKLLPKGTKAKKYSQFEEKDKEEKTAHILFERASGEIIGVSERCYHSYGLSSKLFTGEARSNALDISSIFPCFIRDKVESLETGIKEIEIDTSFMKDNHFFLAMNKTDNVDMDNQEDKNESIDLDSDDQEEAFGKIDEEEYRLINQRFVRKKVKAWISVREVYIDFLDDHSRKEICCISFYDSGDNESKAGFEVEEDLIQSIEMMEDSDSAEQEGVQSVNQSFDARRMVKEAKETISEKKTPQVVKNLRAIYAFVIIVYSILYVMDYFLKKSYHGILENSVLFSIASFQRTKLVSELRFYNSKLELLANGYLDTVSEEGLTSGQLKEEIFQKIDELSISLNKIQSTCTKGLRFLQQNAHISQNFEYPLYYISKNKKEFYTPTPYQEAIYQYTSCFSGITNSNFENFMRNPESPTIPIERVNYLKIRKNSFEALLDGSKEVSNYYVNFAEETLKTAITYRYYSFYGRQTYRLLIVIWVLSALISALRSSREVIMIFALVPSQYLKQFQKDIQRFSNFYIGEYFELKNHSGSFKSKSHNNNKNKEGNEFSDGDSEDANQSIDFGRSMDKEKGQEDEGDTDSKVGKEAKKSEGNSENHKKAKLFSRKILGEGQKKKGKVKRKFSYFSKKNTIRREFKKTGVIRSENDEERDESKEKLASILKNQTGNMSVLITFTAILTLSLIALAYGLFLLELSFIESAGQILNVGRLLGESSVGIGRSFNSMYQIVSIYDQKDIELAQKVHQQSLKSGYTSLGNLTQIQSQAYMIKDFWSEASGIMKNNFCQNFIKAKLTNEECNNELFSKGLETISVYILENSRTAVSSIEGTTNTEESIREIINKQETVNLERTSIFASNGYTYLINKLLDATRGGYDLVASVNFYVLSFWMVSMFQTYLVCHFVIIKYINAVVSKARGMLKIIPLDVLCLNKKLMGNFLQKRLKNDEDKRRRRMKYRS